MGTRKIEIPAGPTSREIALVAVIAVLFLAHLQFLTQYLVEVDAHFHIKMAELMWANKAPVSHNFPWTQTSLFRDGFSDSSFLFHLILIPFTWFGDDVFGAKVAAVVLGSTFLTTFYWFLRKNGCRLSWFFLALLMGSGSLFLFRLVMARGFLVSMILGVLGLHAAVSGNRRLMFAVGVLYPLCYTAFQVAIVLAGIQVIAQLLRRERPDWPLVGYATGGVVLGNLIHPNFPYNLWVWWVQNIHVLWLKWAGNVELFFGGELYPPLVKFLLFSTTTATLCIVASLVALALSNAPRRTSTVSVMGAMLFFGFLTLLSKRFVEYSVPFSIAFAAFVARDLLEPGPPHGFGGSRGIARFRMGAIVAILVVLFAHSYFDIRRDILSTQPPALKGAAEWLLRNTAEGTQVFTCDWDDFPELFHYNDRNRYLVGLDPAFFYVWNPDLWKLWFDVANGGAADLYNPMVKQFNARYVVCTNDFTTFLSRAAADPRFQIVYRSPTATVLRLGPDLDFLTRWAICGPLGLGDAAEAEGRITSSDNRILESFKAPEGKAAKEAFVWTAFPVATLGSYVDLERMLGKVANAFAYATLALDSPVEQDVTFKMGFDDFAKVWVNGEPVFVNPGPRPLAMDDVTFKAHLKQGRNALLVRCGNYTGHWGFYLRLDTRLLPVREASVIRAAP